MAFPTTFADLYGMVIAKVRLDTSNATDVTRAKDWVNQAYAQLMVETEAYQNDADITLTPGADCYSIPAGIIRIKQIVAAPASDLTSFGAPLEATSLEDILERRQASSGVTTNAQSVSMYALNGMNQLLLYPTPTTADKIRVWYVQLPTALSADADVPIVQEPWPKAIEYRALSEAADFLNDPKMDEYRALAEQWEQKFRRHVHRRQGGPVRQLRMPGLRYTPRDRSADVATW